MGELRHVSDLFLWGSFILTVVYIEKKKRLSPNFREIALALSFLTSLKDFAPC